MLRAAAFLTIAAILFGCSTNTVVRSDAPGSARAGALPEPPLCGAGARPTLGGTCEPLGPHAPGAGFTAAGDGWGHVATKPPAICAGATSARLGSKDCAPLDDCTKAFPPAGAIVLHDGDDIIAAARATGGKKATIALDRGTYASFGVSGTNLTLIGRCARDVIIRGTGQGTGVGALNGGTLDVESVTITGFDYGADLDGAEGRFAHVVFSANGAGLRASHGSTVSISESVLEGDGRGGTDPIRAALAMTGSTIKADAVDVRGVTRAFTAFDGGSLVDVKRSIAVASPTATEDFLLLAMMKGAIHVHDSYLATSREALAQAGQAPRFDGAGPAEVLVEGSVVEQKGTEGSDLVLLDVTGGGTLTMKGTTVRSQALVAANVSNARSRFIAEDSVVVMDGKGLPKRTVLDALHVLGGASAQLTHSAVVGAQGIGIGVFDESSMLSLDGSLLTRTTPASSSTSTTAFGLLIVKNAIATIRDSSLTANEGIALSVGFAAKVEVDDALVDDTRMAGGILGEGVVVMTDGELAMQSSMIRGSAAVGLVMLAAKGNLREVRVVDTPVGVNIWEMTVVRSGEAPEDRQLLMYGVTFDRTETPLQEGKLAVSLPASPTGT